MMNNRGRPWDEMQDAELKRRIEKHETVAVIARDMERTVDSIRGRAWQLGLTLRSSRRPWRDGVPRPRQRTSEEDQR